ncbi:MAG: FHA domain-containing protein [Deltaproteobacteria bacterium]|nr:FHA domain-containing protein [Deltaproteobacteria bacterium]
MFTISITEKGGQKKLVECTKSAVTLGRLQGNDIVLPLGNVSKKHAQIQLINKEFTVTDIGSTNGTYVNGRKITGPTPLEPGDKVYLGEFIVSVSMNENDEPSSPDIPVISSDRPSIPSPVPKGRKSVPPPKSFGGATPLTLEQMDDDEDTLTSIDISALPEIKSNFQFSPGKSKTEHPGPFHLRSSRAPLNAPVEQLIDFVAIEERQMDRATLPNVADPVVAGRVRQILKPMISRLAEAKQLPEDYTRGSLFMETFLSIVDLGPLATLLNNPDIDEIRINGQHRVQVVAKGNVVAPPEEFTTERQLAAALHCLIAGLPGSRTVAAMSGGRFRLETGDLIAYQPARNTHLPAVVIYRQKTKTMPDSAMAPIRFALESGGSIAILGDSALSRLMLMEQILDECTAERVAVVEPLPLIQIESDNHFHFNLPPGQGNTGMMTELTQAVHDFGAQRLMARIGSWTEMPALFQMAAKGTPIIADVPLGSGGDLALSLRAGFLSISEAPSLAVTTFTRIFDIVVICSPSDSGNLVEKIVHFKQNTDDSLKVVTAFDAG